MSKEAFYSVSKTIACPAGPPEGCRAGRIFLSHRSISPRFLGFLSLSVSFDTCANLSPTWGGKGAAENTVASPGLNELKEDILNRAHARAREHQHGSTARTMSADDVLQRGSGELGRVD